MKVDYYKPIGKLIIDLEINRHESEWFFFGLFWGKSENSIPKKIFSFRIPRIEEYNF